MADAFLIRSGGENVTPEVTEQETIIQNITEALVGKVYGANATPETILKGYSAYVHQELVEGTLEMPEPGVTGIDYGEITLTSKQNQIVVNHNLGVVPKQYYLVCDYYTYGTDSITYAVLKTPRTSYTIYYRMVSNSVNGSTADNGKITFNPQSSYPFMAYKYYWIAIA